LLNWGIYSVQLIKAAKVFTNGFKSVGAAHVEAAEKTLEVSKAKPTLQHPDAVILRCMSSQELIISINPSGTVL